MDTTNKKNDVVKGNEGTTKAFDIQAALRELFSVRMIQRLKLCGFIAGRIWVRLSIPGLLKLFITRIH
ncbi:hypothetical protein AC622_07170 [Bacillus sp. FJAT-27916]|uniref:hypothetical protein n=1 Tax=Bacillaceae TaxID=186817 RepID=UPI00067109A8|nr:hypothetical protein [Bacillus sp. FJAT-27916]KMY44056.1 hypothetical protein AC622_07170 [Bacillus sp. FJAT-27916]